MYIHGLSVHIFVVIIVEVKGTVHVNVEKITNVLKYALEIIGQGFHWNVELEH